MKENPMKNFDVKVLIAREQNLKWPFRPTFKREKRLCNGTIAIEKRKCRINLSKSIYSGRSVLHLRSIVMQYFCYDYIKSRYSDKTEMALTDTDSFMYKFEARVWGWRVPQR